MTDDLHTPDAAPLPEPEPQEPPRSATTNTRRIDLKYNPHEGIDEPYLIFPNNQQGIAAAADLSTYISRARSLDTQAAIRLTARGSVLAVFACSLAPETMLDNTPTILGMRALNLAKPSTLDIVVDSAALLERLARIEESEMVLYLPPVTVHTEWAGACPESPPVSTITMRIPASLLRIGVLHELLPHAAPLVLGIDSNHINLTHLILRVNTCANPSDRVLTLNRNRHILRFLIEYFLQIAKLSLLPSLRIESIINELGDVVVHPRKNGSPGAK